MFLTFALMEYSPEGMLFTENAILDGNFWNGEIWRIFSYAFLQQSDIVCLLFHTLIFLYIAAPLEAVWGTRFFLSLYFVSVLGGGITSLLFQSTLTSGWHVDLTLMLIHGFLFPESLIYLFFIFPVKIKHLAIFSSVIFLLNSVSMGLWNGIVFFLGMLSGVSYYYLMYYIIPKYYQIRWHLKQNKPLEYFQERNSAKIYERAKKISQDPQNASQEDKEWFENLDKNFIPDRPICSPYSFCPNSKICPRCSCFGFCTKRDLSNKEKENKS